LEYSAPTSVINLMTWLIKSRNSSVGMATGYGLDGRDSIPNRGKVFLFFTASRPALGPAQFPIQRVEGAISPRVKLPRREADHTSI
jgi:hypothetical protein